MEAEELDSKKVWPNQEEVERTAKGILEARANYPYASFQSLYNLLIMPPDLYEAHDANDKAVLKAYGLKEDATEDEIISELFRRYVELDAKDKGIPLEEYKKQVGVIEPEPPDIDLSYSNISKIKSENERRQKVRGRLFPHLKRRRSPYRSKKVPYVELSLIGQKDNMKFYYYPVSSMTALPDMYAKWTAGEVLMVVRLGRNAKAREARSKKPNISYIGWDEDFEGYKTDRPLKIVIANLPKKSEAYWEFLSKIEAPQILVYNFIMQNYELNQFKHCLSRDFWGEEFIDWSKLPDKKVIDL